MSCSTGKHGWPTKAAAKRSLKRAQSAAIPVTRAYHCRECGRWHLTSQKQGKHAA